jgi:hypothetical protein
MSVVPKIKCPPDYSIRCFRIVDPLSYGIVKGAATEVSIPTKGICIPVNRYDDKRMILRAGKTHKLDIDGIAEYGDLSETYQFTVTVDQVGVGTSHRYDLFTEELSLIGSIEFVVSDNFNDSLANAIAASPDILSKVSFSTGTSANGTFNFSVSAVESGIKYRHLFYFDTDGFGGSNVYPYLHPGNLTQKYRKYPNGAVKIILIVAEFDKVNTDTCGCADSSGAMLSNKKYFQYSFASDYEKSAATPVLAQGSDSLPATQWKQESADHIGYHFSSSDIVSMLTTPAQRQRISAIQGFDISMDGPLGNGEEAYLQHVWSPATVSWKNFGEMNLLTGGQDVEDSDQLFIETIYLKNPHSFDIPLRVLIGV